MLIDDIDYTNIVDHKIAWPHTLYMLHKYEFVFDHYLRLASVACLWHTNLRLVCVRDLKSALLGGHRNVNHILRRCSLIRDLGRYKVGIRGLGLVF